MGGSSGRLSCSESEIGEYRLARIWIVNAGTAALIKHRCACLALDFDDEVGNIHDGRDESSMDKTRIARNLSSKLWCFEISMRG
jgi:hypothetical protein